MDSLSKRQPGGTAFSGGALLVVRRALRVALCGNWRLACYMLRDDIGPHDRRNAAALSADIQ